METGREEWYADQFENSQIEPAQGEREFYKGALQEANKKQ